MFLFSFKVDLKESIYLMHFFSSASIFPPPVPISLYLCRYLSTLASSTLIILFSEKLKVFQIKNIVKENSGYLEIFHLLK